MLTRTLKKRYLATALSAICLIPSVQAEINFSGFISIEGGWLEDESLFSYKDYEDSDLVFTQNTVGLQASSDLSDNLSATIQIIARGQEGYTLKPEWAYLTWQATDNTKVRIGSIGTPFYMFSDFQDIGYAYAWTRPPEEVYTLPITTFDGVNVYHNRTIGSFDGSLEIYYGGLDDSFNLGGTEIPSSTRNQIGIASTLGRDWWTIRAAFHTATLTNDISNLAVSEDQTFGDFADQLRFFGLDKNADLLLPQDDPAYFTELGYTIDTGRFVSVGEYIIFDYQDNFFAKNIRYYVMGGVRVGNVLFHVTTAGSRDQESTPQEGILETDPAAGFIPVLEGLALSQVEKRDVLSLGIRWDLPAGTALKFQLDQLRDTDDVTNIELNQRVYSVSLQTVF